MKNIETMTGAEIREVFGNREALELEQLAAQLKQDIEFIKSRMDEEWDEGLLDELHDALLNLRRVQQQIREIRKKYTRINTKARPVK